MCKKQFIVSAVYVQGLLRDLDGGGQISEQELWAIEPDDEQAVRKVIREHTRPGFIKVKEAAAEGKDTYNSYEHCKESLRWLINLNDEKEYRWIFNNGQFCIEPIPQSTENYQRFFIWIWKELCGDEDWHIEDMSLYVENDDPYAIPTSI